MSKQMMNKSKKIQRRSQRYFRPDMIEKKIFMFFRIDEEQDQNIAHILNIDDIHEFSKQKQIETYPVYGLEFTFNLNVVDKEQIKKMLEVIYVYKDTVEEIVLKITNTLSEELNLEDIQIPEFIFKKPISLTFDWRSIKQIGNNEKMLPILRLFHQLSSEQDIKKLNIQFAQLKSKVDKIKETISFIVSLQKIEDLKIQFTNYIHYDAFEPLGDIQNPLLKQNIRKIDFDFTNSSLSSKGSVYLSEFLRDCINLDSVKLNLRYNKLEDNDLINILQSIEDKQQIQNLHLSLSSNRFKQEGSNYIVHFLTSFSSLGQLKSLSLDLKLFEFENEQTCLDLFGLFNKLTQLTNLILNFQRISIINSKQCLQDFSLSIGQMNQLKQLSIDLSWSNIKSEISDLFVQIGNLTQLTHLYLGLLGIGFGERRMKFLEQGIQQLKSLQMLTLNMDLRSTYRGNNQIYQDLIQIIERELTPLMNLELTEINEFSSNYYINIKEMYSRVQQKMLLRKQLVYSILVLKKLFMIGKIKRKEMIEDFTQFLMLTKYFKSPDNFIPPAPPIEDLLG